jgi:hypothetical protein
MDRDELLQQMLQATSPNDIATAVTEAREWLRDHPRDHQVAFLLAEVLKVEHDLLTVA